MTNCAIVVVVISLKVCANVFDLFFVFVFFFYLRIFVVVVAAASLVCFCMRQGGNNLI